MSRPQRIYERRPRPAAANLRPHCPFEATAMGSRDELILRHLPQVKLVALRIRERLPPSVSLEDLISAGTVGLIAAIDRYDGVRNVKLATYAEYKIRGAILDALRDLDWMPRQRRRQVKRMEAAVSLLEQKLGRRPNAEEVAGHLGVPVDEYHQWNADSNGVNLASLDSALHGEDSRTTHHLLADHNMETPANRLERSELEDLLAEVIQEMPDVEKTVLQLYFFEEMTLREIAAITGLHESRISQLKARGLARMRSALAPQTTLQPSRK